MDSENKITMNEKTIKLYQKLAEIQSKVSVGKNNTSNGNVKYSYRKLEEMLAALKPILSEQKCVLLFEDEIISVGDSTTQNNVGLAVKANNYIKSVAKLVDYESGAIVEAVGHSREEEAKGKSAEQATGSATTFARKSALNAMFLFDDGDSSGSDNGYQSGGYNNGYNSGYKSNSYSNSNNGKSNSSYSYPPPLSEPPAGY